VTVQVGSLFDVKGQVALVTGGSQGIGYMIAEGLLGAGATVYICARKEAELNRAVEALELLGPCFGVVADLSTTEGCAAAHAFVARHTDRLNILVNNAGAVWAAPIDEFPRSGFEKVMNVNVIGLFGLIQACLPLLRAAAADKQPARVINISSTAGLTPPASDTFSYSASKAAVVMLSRHLARRLAPEDITVNVIAPGPFPTRMSRSDIKEDGSHRWDIPLNRVGTPEDIVGTVIYLSSRAGAYLTGVTIPLAGGMTTAD
jgi:NAD(P)-dependent dehydrogenase (short-subunit alcohol dehydrogenase family)